MVCVSICILCECVFKTRRPKLFQKAAAALTPVLFSRVVCLLLKMPMISSTSHHPNKSIHPMVGIFFSFTSPWCRSFVVKRHNLCFIYLQKWYFSFLSSSSLLLSSSSFLLCCLPCFLVIHLRLHLAPPAHLPCQGGREKAKPGDC